MNEDERIGLIEAGINHPFWTEYLRPLLAEKAKNALRALAAGKSETDDVRRGQYQAYQDIFDAPLAEVEIYKRDQQQRNDTHAEDARANLRAVEGFGSPLEPGALSEEESEATSAATARENR